MVRAGVGWQPSDRVGAYLDGQYLRLEYDLRGSPRNSVETGRISSGFEYLPIKGLTLRVGGTVDTSRQLSPSAGVGVAPVSWLQLDLAYVYNAFPELRRDFGPAHRISLSLAAVFY